MYLAIILIIGIWILAGTTLHIWYRRFYTQQGEKLFLYKAQIVRWEKEGYDVSIQRNKVEWLIKKWEGSNVERKLLKLLRKYSKLIKYRVIKRLLYLIYYRIVKKSGKILIFVTVLLNLAITLSAVGLLITKDVSFTIGISVAVVGFGFIIWSLTRLSKRHQPLLTDMVIILVITVIFIMVSSSYLHVKSFNDVKNSITGPFTTENSSTPLE